MELIKWEPFSEIDRFFENQIFPTLGKFNGDFAVDVFEEDNKVVAKMNLPGMKSEDIDISVEDEYLTISGRREEEKETKNKDYYSKEIRRGSFSRTVALPKKVDAQKTEAKYADGVLVVTLPVVEGAEEKGVKIKVQ